MLWRGEGSKKRVWLIEISSDAKILVTGTDKGTDTFKIKMFKMLFLYLKTMISRII